MHSLHHHNFLGVLIKFIFTCNPLQLPEEEKTESYQTFWLAEKASLVFPFEFICAELAGGQFKLLLNYTCDDNNDNNNNDDGMVTQTSRLASRLQGSARGEKHSGIGKFGRIRNWLQRQHPCLEPLARARSADTGQMNTTC